MKSEKSSPSITPKKPKRHWLLTSFIVLLIFLNGLIVLLSFLAITFLGQQKINNPELYSTGVYSFILILAIYNIFCLNNLLKLQRWAFWGYCIGAALTFFLLIYIDPHPEKILSNLLFCAGNPFILFCILYFLGGKQSAWEQMKTTSIRL